MQEPSPDTCFLQELPADCRSLRTMAFAHHLDGHFPTQDAVIGAVDPSHAAASERAPQFVALLEVRLRCDLAEESLDVRCLSLVGQAFDRQNARLRVAVGRGVGLCWLI